ncbi:transmembrane protein 74 [Anableps anableps]
MAALELSDFDETPASAPRGSVRGAEAEAETAFSCGLDEERLMRAEEQDMREEEELYLLSEDELSSDGSRRSVDYGFIVAVSCLVSGISLVAITYTIPRDVRVDPDSVSAREMERLEREKAGVGAHLDRCVIAGLCLLTLGGVLLSTLLMVSMWKGEMMRRKAFAYSKHSANLYGSMSLRAGSSSTLESCSNFPAAEDSLEVFS